METADIVLLHLGVLIICAKLSTALFRRLKQPPVIGLLLLGIVLGPSAIDWIESDRVINWIAKIGVLFLLFEAGLETDVARIREQSREALLPALGGILIPFGFGMGLSALFGFDRLHQLVMGTIFVATSVSVSVATLMEINRLRSPEGRCIVNAAIIDDIVGILVVSFVFGLAAVKGGQEGVLRVVLIEAGDIVGFFIIIFLFGYFLIGRLFHNIKRIGLDSSVLSIGIAIIFLYAWLAEESGVAAITGAYFAGLFLGQTDYSHKIREGIGTLGKTFFADIFFINIGLSINLLNQDAGLVFTGLFIITALLGKFGGSWLGARFTGFDGSRSLRIGIGMMPRGEVALIIANMALQQGFIRRGDLSATILMVVISTLITPILLKTAFTRLRKKTF